MRRERLHLISGGTSDRAIGKGHAHDDGDKRGGGDEREDTKGGERVGEERVTARAALLGAGPVALLSGQLFLAALARVRGLLGGSPMDRR